MARILVVGCGKIGYPVAQAMVLEGHDVCGVKRSLPDPADPAIHWFSLDIRDADAVAQLPADFDQVIIILTPAARSEEGYRQIYQQGLGNLLQRLQTTDPKPLLIFVSATSVYAQQNGEWVDEDSATKPSQYNGRSLLQAEQQVLEFSSGSVVVRFSGIYGATRNRLLRQLEQPLKIQASPPLFSNRIHQDDCIGVLLHLANLQRAGGLDHNTYLATDFEPVAKFEMMTWLAETAGLIPPEPTGASENATGNKRCRNQRLIASGYQFKYPGYRQGYTQMLNGTQ
jgi:nucleoside-diphosphate-sugar epimerase